MIPAKSFAAFEAGSALKPYSFERREPGPNDVQIEILYCGVCHSDLHSVRAEWGNRNFPLVPGHEIVGKVERVGNQVKKFKVGDSVGVGCMVDSCRTCASCKQGLQQYCEVGGVYTYGSKDPKHPEPYTQGGYSTKIVVDQEFVLRMPAALPLNKAAPLLCAGITTYSPLRHWKIGKGHRVGVVGLGGLGHMAVKLAASMGAHVTVLSTSEGKRADSQKLGAHDFVVTKDPAQTKALANTLDLILDTVSAAHDYNLYLGLLKRDATMVLLGLPDPQTLHAGSVIFNRRSLAGSLIGGIPETQEMLDYCAKHEITCDIEMIPMKDINTAYERMLKGDVHYRFVIDMQSLK